MFKKFALALAAIAFTACPALASTTTILAAGSVSGAVAGSEGSTSSHGNGSSSQSSGAIAGDFGFATVGVHRDSITAASGNVAFTAQGGTSTSTGHASAQNANIAGAGGLSGAGGITFSGRGD
jgi:hypothetical protein